MGLKLWLAKIFASWVTNKVSRDAEKALQWQQYWMNQLLKKAAKTSFGRDHAFHAIESYEQFKAAVPIRDYEALRIYMDRIVAGEKDITWPGKPLYFAKTSGTTSGVKYIPISKESISYHINSARNALLGYIDETGNTSFVAGKLIFLSGSPVMDLKNGIFTGRLSGIVNHHVPAYLRKNQMPSFETNCIEDWEDKVAKITEETLLENMTLISGIPPWVQMYFDLVQAKTGKLIKEVFPNFNLFVYGGVNMEPYRKKLEASIGKKIDSIETYPASEGFIAYQNSQTDDGLLLLCNNGIFYEFIQADTFYDEHPKRVSLADVELNTNYAIILNTNAGLFGYNIGDTIKFVSLNPYKIKVTGRIKHFISAFGEHVIGEEVEYALQYACSKMEANVIEFTVAPQVNPEEGGLPYHEWFIAFEKLPEDVNLFAQYIDEAMQQKNIYYKDLITGNILQTLKVRILVPDAFIQYMKLQGKLGGQNKVPRLSNDRKIAGELSAFLT
jgi:hypothetical protein